MLYVTSGDGSSDSDTHLSGQDLTRLLAKVLRIDVDHPAAAPPMRSPPTIRSSACSGARPETWAYGFRNPWRITCDRPTGEIWVGQNGQDLWEQAYLVRRGENYGWSVMEGGHAFYPAGPQGPTPFTKPMVEHPHSEFRR
jgi:glucose/arabinose dehydrogenase